MAPAQLNQPSAVVSRNGNTQPHSIEAEQGVLGSMLISPCDAIAACAQKITPDHFYDPVHRIIYKVLIDLDDAGQAIDLITFTQALRDRNLLESVGGASYVTSLFTFVPSSVNVQYYIEIALDKKARRVAIEQAEQTIARAADEREDFADAKRGGGGLPDIEDAATLVSANIALPFDVIGGVLHAGAKLVLGGASKSFKTQTLTDMAASVATGSDWLDFKTKQGRVLYINLEIQRPFFARRISVICDAKGVKVEHDSLHVWNLRGYATDIRDLLPKLLRGIGCKRYVLIIIDPIYKLLGGRDENKAGDMAAVLNDVERLTVETGAAVAFGAHFSKGNQAAKETIDRIGGSGVFARDPDTILTFTKHEEPECFTLNATLRNHAPLEPFVVRWEYPLMQRQESLDPARLKKVAGREQDVRANDVLALLDRPMTTKEWKAVSLEDCGISESTFHRRLKQIRKEGSAFRCPAGYWRQVAPPSGEHDGRLPKERQRELSICQKQSC